MPDIDRITDLTIKYVKGVISSIEQAELDVWLIASETNRRRFEERIKEENTLTGLGLWEEAGTAKEEGRSRISYTHGTKEFENAKISRFHRFGWKRFASVAAALLLIAGTVFYIYRPHNTENTWHGLAVPTANDIPPGGNKAILTLSNGKMVVLDSAKNGSIAAQGGVDVIKLDSGEIAYQHTGNGTGEVQYNTISTPRGGQYKVILPDGSKVWLNAATSIRYPTVFNGIVRSLELTGGEAYFEVAHHASQPFTVRIRPARQGDQELAVNVLGTDFDINAYSDEPLLKATLLDGSIKVARGTESVLLVPGDQAQVNVSSATSSLSGSIHILRDADIKTVTAWKNGFFRFNNDDIETIMRQIARWYDVDVTYQVKRAVIKLTGVVGRDNNLSDVLNAMEEGGVHFKIEGRKIIVLP